MPEVSAFGRRLREARETRRMTQQELGTKSKVPSVMISHFETGVRPNASADNLVKLADALEVSIDYLLGRTDDPVPRSGRVESALLRTLGDAPKDVIDSVVSIAEMLVRREQDKGPAK